MLLFGSVLMFGSCCALLEVVPTGACSTLLFAFACTVLRLLGVAACFCVHGIAVGHWRRFFLPPCYRLLGVRCVNVDELSVSSWPHSSFSPLFFSFQARGGTTTRREAASPCRRRRLPHSSKRIGRKSGGAATLCGCFLSLSLLSDRCLLFCRHRFLFFCRGVFGVSCSAGIVSCLSTVMSWIRYYEITSVVIVVSQCSVSMTVRWCMHASWWCRVGLCAATWTQSTPASGPVYCSVFVPDPPVHRHVQPFPCLSALDTRATHPP